MTSSCLPVGGTVTPVDDEEVWAVEGEVGEEQIRVGVDGLPHLLVVDWVTRAKDSVTVTVASDLVDGGDLVGTVSFRKRALTRHERTGEATVVRVVPEGVRGLYAGIDTGDPSFWVFQL